MRVFEKMVTALQPQTKTQECFVEALLDSLQKDDEEFVRELVRLTVRVKKHDADFTFYDYIYSCLPENRRTTTNTIRL